jgi:5'-3' exoribonuclease 2
MFLGNDFLPHLPTMDMKKGAIRHLTYIYWKEFSNMGGYLTDSHEVNMKRVQHFITLRGTLNTIIREKRNWKSFSKKEHVVREDVIEKHKRLYYAGKFDDETEEDQERTKKAAALKYVEGLCWVMRYY